MIVTFDDQAKELDCYENLLRQLIGISFAVEDEGRVRVEGNLRGVGTTKVGDEERISLTLQDETRDPPIDFTISISDDAKLLYL